MTSVLETEIATREKVEESLKVFQSEIDALKLEVETEHRAKIELDRFCKRLVAENEVCIYVVSFV